MQSPAKATARHDLEQHKALDSTKKDKGTHCAQPLTNLLRLPASRTAALHLNVLHIRGSDFSEPIKF